MRVPVPDHLAKAAAIRGAFPHNAYSIGDFGRAVRPYRLDVLETVEHVDALNRRRTDDGDDEGGAPARQVHDVPHHRAVDASPFGGAQLRIVVEERAARVERHLDAEMHA